MTALNPPVPKWTPNMQLLWDRAMLLERTRGAYGCTFPVPGTTFKPPTPGTMLHSILFVALATDDEYEAHLAEVREDMIAWKERVAASGNKRREHIVRPVDLTGIDLSQIDI